MRYYFRIGATRISIDHIDHIEGLDTTSLASGLHDFFVDKVRQVKNKVELGLRSAPGDILSARLPSVSAASVMQSFTRVTLAEVKRLIRSAPTKTSPLNQLPISVVKSCGREFSAIITHMANTSIVAGRFSSTWKAGLVTPLLKKRGLDAGDFKDFRPITNLTTLSKMLERLALARLKSHIVTSPNCCPLQSAYRAAHSTETALVKIIDDILTLVDSGSAVELGLDISVAFVTVSHSNLLSRLEHDCGIEGAALLWIDSYLSNRTFFVRVGGSSSSVAESSSGLPQGSVLGPILFTAYVAPIGRLIESFGVAYHNYADDTQLYTALTAKPDICISLLESAHLHGGNGCGRMTCF